MKTELNNSQLLKIFLYLKKWEPTCQYNYLEKVKSQQIGLEGQEKLIDMDAWTYSHRTMKIGELMNYKVDLGGGNIQDMSSALDATITKIFVNFAEINFPSLDIGDKYARSIAHLSDTVRSKFKHRISVWSLMHFVDLLGMEVEPCDEKLYGFDPKLILKNLNKYLNYCLVMHNDFMEKLYADSDHHMSAAERQWRLAKIVADNPQWNETMDKIEAKVKAEEYQALRGERYVQEAKSNFEENIKEIAPDKYKEWKEQYEGA